MAVNVPQRLPGVSGLVLIRDLRRKPVAPSGRFRRRARMQRRYGGGERLMPRSPAAATVAGQDWREGVSACPGLAAALVHQRYQYQAGAYACHNGGDEGQRRALQ